MIRTNRTIPAAQLRLLIFDLDGTLVDSRQDLANSINAMLRNYHRAEHAPEVIADFIGDGAPTLVRRSLGFTDDHNPTPKEEEFIEDALIFFLEYYREHKLDFTYVYDGVKAALTELSRKQSDGGERMLAVLSNKPVHPSRAIVTALGLGGFFKAVYGGNSFETKKPDPLGVKALMKEFGCAPQETVIVGDSHIDIETAQNAGIYSVGVTYGLAPESLEHCSPDVLVDAAAELIEVLGS